MARARLGGVVELFVVPGARAVGRLVVLAAHTSRAATELVRSDFEQLGGSVRILFAGGTTVAPIGAMDRIDEIDNQDARAGLGRGDI